MANAMTAPFTQGSLGRMEVEQFEKLKFVCKQELSGGTAALWKKLLRSMWKTIRDATAAG